MNSSTDKTAEETAEAAVERNSAETSSNGTSVKLDGDDQIKELRRLLVDSEGISVILPEALARSSKSSPELAETTLPIVEENIRDSVLRDPKILADALFPVIGPAIRKAISAALSTMVQSLNQTLELAVSPKSIGWRIEAMRSGKTFGEVVMLKTLLYRVEQVFLIHRKTGLLLQHTAQNPEDIEDGDMVSAMLTAIADFAHDSFKTDENATLDSFKVSGLNVWIEESPDAIFAAVIRGNPPMEYREKLSLGVEKVQFSFTRELKNFEGESDIFAGAQPALQECLLSQAAESGKKSVFSPTNLALGFLGLLLVVVIGYFGWDYWRWSGLLHDIRNKPGYVLTDYDRGWFTHSVSGLRDPLAANPKEFLSDNRYDGDDVTFSWREYQDPDSKFVLERAAKLLRPPKGVALTHKDGVLIVNGIVTPEWIAEAERLAPLISGVHSVELIGVEGLISKIEGSKLLFDCGTTSVNSADELKVVAGDLPKLAAFGRFRVDITGHADDTGSSAINTEISKKRAVVVSEAIQKELTDPLITGKIALNEIGSDKKNDNCMVTFNVTPLSQ